MIRAAVTAAVLLTAVACSASEQQTAPEPRGALELRDVAREVGLELPDGGPPRDVVEMTGGGVCWLDYDGDGWLDLFATELFRNREGRFEGVRPGPDLRDQGCVAADLDADGRVDLLVTGADRSVLLWNEGDGEFSEETLGFGWLTGAAAGDLNGDGLPELVVAGYADLFNRVPEATLGFPSTYLGVRDLLFLNEGGRRFREAGRDAGLEVARFAHGLGALLSDLDRDGDLDLYVANDSSPNRLYENVAWPGGRKADPAGLGFRLEERAAAAGVADAGAGMGIAAGDFDGDALPDLLVTNARRQTHGVFRNLSAGAFADVRGTLGPSFTGSTGWGASWGDLDLDADLDLVLVNGDIPVTDLAAGAEPVEAFLNDTDVLSPARLSLPRLNARGSAAADYDNDGDLDVAVLSLGGRLALLENAGSGGNWLEVAGLPPGAVATAVLPDGRRLAREAHAGGSYLSSEDPRLHFGLGPARTVRLLVRWPSGAETQLGDVEANRVLELSTPEAQAESDSHAQVGCRRADLEGRSVVRVWNEALLAAIRRDVPAPTVHARNLFHVSAAMWDAWAAYDPVATGYLVREKHEAADVEAAREEAISYAAYRILLHRYSLAAGLEDTFGELTGTMRSLCYPIGLTSTTGDSPAALGNRIAAAVIARGREDGSLERLRYADPEYRPVNEPLVVAEPGARMRDPARWQPLALDRQVAQNGLPIPAKVQTFIGSHWGGVDGFALPAGGLDPGPPPTDLGRAAVEVIRYSSRLDGDYGRAIAEFWADGPDSETPPGHWNTLAHAVSDELAPPDRLEWDVKLAFALNGALHDAAIAAWGAKRRYDSSRPISLVRYLGARNELPLVRGLVERRGGRTMIRAWRGPGAGIGWIRAADWLPYQRPTFVTPAFAGYVSGHSTFSRAAAEVLTAFTGSASFPGGPLEWRIPKGSFAHEPGPPRDIVLRWSTYRDAAEEAGISRLYGGIHIAADHYAGRKLGALCGQAAWERAQRYFEGTA